MSSDPKLSFRFEPRRYDSHWPANRTVVVIERAGWPGNEFGVWLPEAAHTWNNWKGNTQDWSLLSDDEATWQTTANGVRISADLRVDQSNECIWYTYDFENTSNAIVEGVTSSTCLHLVNAPEFASIRGERIWACLDGAWRTTDEVPRHLSVDPRRVMFLREGSRTERSIVHSSGFPYSIMSEEASHPLVAVESFGAERSMGIASKGMSYLFNNNEPLLRCIHSEPKPIESVQPGGKARQEGVILFCEGNHEILLDRFRCLAGNDW